MPISCTNGCSAPMKDAGRAGSDCHAEESLLTTTFLLRQKPEGHPSFSLMPSTVRFQHLWGKEHSRLYSFALILSSRSKLPKQTFQCRVCEEWQPLGCYKQAVHLNETDQLTAAPVGSWATVKQQPASALWLTRQTVPGPR